MKVDPRCRIGRVTLKGGAQLSVFPTTELTECEQVLSKVLSMIKGGGAVEVAVVVGHADGSTTSCFNIDYESPHASAIGMVGRLDLLRTRVMLSHFFEE